MVNKMMADTDTDGDGTIDFNEFVVMMSKLADKK